MMIRGLGAPTRVLELVRQALFVNLHWTQIVLKNMVWATLAEAVVRGLKFLLLPILARVFGPAEFGKFAFAYSFAAMFDVVFDSGLALTTTRELAVAKVNEHLLPDILLMKLALGGLGVAGLALGMMLITPDPTTRWMILVLGVAFFVLEMVNLSFSVFRAWQRMEYEFLVRVAQALFLVLGVGWIAWRAPSVLNVTYAYLISGILTLGLILVVMRGGPWRISLHVRRNVWARVLRVALPLALASGATTVYMNVDSVMLGYFGKIIDTGWYNVAIRITGVLLVPTGLLSLVIFPAFASTSANVDVTFRRRWDTWSAGMVAVGAYIACTVVATADPVIGVVFGPAFHPAGTALKILAITVALIFVYTPSFQAMIVFDRQRTLFWCLLSAAVVNVVLNILLIPPFGLYGSAWATVATHVVILGELFVLAGRCTPLRPVNRALVWAMISAGTAAAAAWWGMLAVGHAAWLAVPVGGIVFAGVWVGLRKSVALGMAASW